jgi:hypothetical protein
MRDLWRDGGTMIHPDIMQLAREEDIAALRRFYRRRRHALYVRVVGTAIGILLMWSAIILVL